MNVGSMFAWGSLNGKSFNWLGLTVVAALKLRGLSLF